MSQPPQQHLASRDNRLFAALKVRDYLYLWVGMLGSAFAMNMQQVAQGWLVYEMTSSPLQLTWVTLSFMLPQVVFSLIGGVLADRVPKKPVIGISPLINGVASLYLAMVIFSGQVTFWHFMAIGFLNGTIMALSIPARTALIPEIVGERLIFNAMAFNTAAWNLSRILGPALAGFMIAMIAGGDTTSTYGVGWVYIILSVLYGFSGVSVLLIKHNGRPSEKSTSSPLQDTIEGLRYVVQSNIVGGLILLSILPFLFGLSIMTLLPAFNTDILLAGPDSLGLLMTGMGVGAIAGSLVLAKLSSLRHKGLWLFATNTLWGVGVFVFGLTSAFEAAFVAICFVGFVSAINMSMNRSLVQLQVSQRMRGRVMSIDLMSHGLMPLGVLPVGYVAEHYGVHAGLMMSGAILALLSLALLGKLRAVRQIDTGYQPLEAEPTESIRTDARAA
ncbi:MAG: MFS transporter [Pseudomonadales bacterium]